MELIAARNRTQAIIDVLLNQVAKPDLKCFSCTQVRYYSEFQVNQVMFLVKHLLDGMVTSSYDIFGLCIQANIYLGGKAEQTISII